MPYATPVVARGALTLFVINKVGGNLSAPLTLQHFALKRPPKNQDLVWVQVLRHVEPRPGVRSSAALVDHRL